MPQSSFPKVRFKNRRVRLPRRRMPRAGALRGMPQQGVPSTGHNPHDARQDLKSLTDILDAVAGAGHDGCTSVRDILRAIGTRSFAPILLVPALILVSPLSGIFGLPTLGAIFMFLVTVQKLMGRPHVWLPEFLKKREVKTDRVVKAVDWLRRPCAWIDGHTRRRLQWLLTPTARTVSLMVIAAICVVIPFLEVLPMVTSIFAAGISFFAIGFLSRDGLFTLLGYGQVLLSSGLILYLVQRVAE